MSKEESRLHEARQQATLITQQAEAEVELAIWDLGPVKQYVRKNGWLKIIKNYLGRRSQEGFDRPWKYLTLPGPNATDIGLLWKHRLVQSTPDGKLNVAICDREHSEKVATNLGRLGTLLAVSDKWLHQELEDPRSELRNQFPFDVINMDICGCLIPPKAKDNLKALRWIFRLQQGRSFLLLLTTKPNDAALDVLEKNLRHNLQKEKMFKEAYVKEFGTDDPRPCMKDQTNFVQLIFPKVIARFALKFGYKTTEHFAARYGRKGKKSGIEYDIVSHSFEFDPLGLDDGSKYEPRFTHVPQDDIEEVVRDELPSEAKTKASESYRDFIGMLPVRHPENVIALLSSDRRLMRKLEREAKALQQWHIRVG